MHIEIPLESFINLHFAHEHKRAFSTTSKTDIHIMIQKVFYATHQSSTSTISHIRCILETLFLYSFLK
jgi:hypothetical protein